MVTYTSDTDEPFEPVVLNYAGTDLPSGGELARCVGLKSEDGDEVEELSVAEFDARGQYGVVVEKVKEAGKEKGGTGEVRAYRVPRGKTRCEYYVLTVMREGGGGLVGVRARAVES